MCWRGTSPPTARFAQEALGFRLYEQIVNDDGSEAGAWMSLTIAAHELIYVADHAGATGRLHHLAFFVDTREDLLRAADLFLDADVPIEAAPSKHAVAQGMFLYVYEPGGNRVEVTTGTHFIYDPTYQPVVWTQAERARGQAWGVKTIETFHTYGTPDLSGRATGPPIPPTSRIPERGSTSRGMTASPGVVTEAARAAAANSRTGRDPRRAVRLWAALDGHVPAGASLAHARTGCLGVRRSADAHRLHARDRARSAGRRARRATRLAGAGRCSPVCSRTSPRRAACAFAPTIWTLIGLRFLQGIAGGVGVVIARAIVRDLFQGSVAARMYAR